MNTWFLKELLGFTNIIADERLYALEYKSKINKIGLWASDKPLPPWIYRSQNK